MKHHRGPSRRSFLAIVAGGAAAGSAFFAVSGRAAQGCTDRDPAPSNGGDPSGRGRRCNNPPPRTGCSDSDPTDPIGGGRNCRNTPSTGCSDSDPTDAGGRGRNCRNNPVTGCSDRDPTDPIGRGRNCGGGGRDGAYPTGRRERRYEVCWVDHPSRSNEDCNMQTYSEWATTFSDGRVEYDTSESAARRAEMEARGYTARWHRMIVNEW